jgi:hypothetical protein
MHFLYEHIKDMTKRQTHKLTSDRISGDLRSFGILRSAARYFFTDVSGQPIGPIFKGHAVKGEFLDSLTADCIKSQRVQISFTTWRKPEITHRISCTQILELKGKGVPCVPKHHEINTQEGVEAQLNVQAFFSSGKEPPGNQRI